jgi:hypothetical protein
MSYMHEYSNKREYKSLREYSLPFDLRRVDPAIWAAGEKDAWEVPERLEEVRHFRLVTRAQARALTRRDPFERKVAALLQYRKPRRKLRKGSS